MTTNLKNCSLLLEINGQDDIEYTISPVPTDAVEQSSTNQVLYTFTVDINKSTTVEINVTRRDGNQSHIIVKQLTVCDVDLQLSNISVYRTATNKIKNSYGFLDELGTYRVKIHTNPISQNYLNYLLNLTKQN